MPACLPLLRRKDRCPCLSLKGETGADLVGDGRGLGGRELGSVEGKTERGLDAWSESLGVAEAQDTEVVDLGLDKGGVVEVGLGADLEVDLAVSGVLGVISGSGTGLDVSVDSVVVRGGVGGEVAETVEGDGVLWGVVAGSQVVLGDLATLDVVGCLGTDEEAVAADDGVGGESWALEEVSELAGVDAWLPVRSREDGVLGLLVWDKGGDELKLEALCALWLELNVVAEDVGGGPCLSEGKAVLSVVELGLEVGVDVVGLVVTDTGNLEGDTVWSLGLDLEGRAVDWAG